MSTELHFDFTREATRRVFFGQAIQHIDDEVKRAMVGRIVSDSSIPKAAQLHDLADVNRAIDISIASAAAKEHARAIYRILAQAEAQVHGCNVEEAHFHEVGLGSTCREILGACTCIEMLAPERITASSVQVGSGTIECSHGTLEVPAPATAAILEKYSIPTCARTLEGELCTPTSAALIAHFVDEFA